MAREIGRPCLLDEALLEKAKHYMIEGYKELGNLVPSVAGLCCYLGVSKSSVYLWAEDNEVNQADPIRREFSDTLSAIQVKQEMMLVDGGLGGVMNSTITKLMLANHGYSEKVQTETKLTVNNSLDDFYADIESEAKP